MISHEALKLSPLHSMYDSGYSVGMAAEASASLGTQPAPILGYSSFHSIGWCNRVVSTRLASLPRLVGKL